MRNNNQSRIKRYKQNRRKRVIKIIVRDIIAFAIAVGYLIYLLLKNINKLVLKGFNKLPKLAKIATIYTLIGVATFGGYSLVNGQEVTEKVIEVEKIKEVIKEVATTEEETPIEYNPYNLTSENEKNIFNKALEIGLDDDQAIIAVSISRHETGHWKSKYFNNYHNFGGIMTSKGIKKYSSYEEGLTDFVSILKKWYFDKGLNTIEQIGAKYCPIGAENDPKGLNQYWVSGVSSFYNNYTNSIK